MDRPERVGARIQKAASGRPPTSLEELDLGLLRKKASLWYLRPAYWATKALRLVVGSELVLRGLLNLAWVSRRLAWEAVVGRYGETCVTTTSGLKEELLYALVPVHGSVLDVGCGTGRWCRAAASVAGSVLGVDSSGETLRAAKARSRDQPNVEFVQGDAFEVIKGRRFDVTLLIHCLEHLDRPEEFLSELALRTDCLIVEVPDFAADPLNPVRHWLGCPWYSDQDHVREYTLSALSTQLMASGWDVELSQQRGGSLVVVGRPTRAGHLS